MGASVITPLSKTYSALNKPETERRWCQTLCVMNADQLVIKDTSTPHTRLYQIQMMKEIRHVSDEVTEAAACTADKENKQ